MDPLTILLTALINFIVARAALGFPIISKWLEDLFNKTTKAVKSAGSITGSTPKELTLNTVAALQKLAKNSTFVHKRYYKFLARIAPKYSNEIWDKFSKTLASSFDAKDRITFDDNEVPNALNEVLSS